MNNTEKVEAFNDVNNTIFNTDNEIPKQSICYTCIAAININSVIKID